MEIVDKVKNLQDLMETIEEIMIFSKLKYHVFVETDLNKFSNLINEGIIKETNSWCEDNCCGKWHGNGFIFMFELENDAVAFKLRWS